MIAIAVDDEPLMLGALTKAIKASADITAVADFTSCEDALDYVKCNSVDVAFLDINMRGMGGLALAEKIIAVCPNCKIVFCTGYEESRAKILSATMERLGVSNCIVVNSLPEKLQNAS